MSAATDLAARHPQLFHLTDAANMPSIARHGLLSTAALLDLHSIAAARRDALERRRRPRRVTLVSSLHGEATLRDNLPSLDAVLARCLVGMTVSEWYATLNRRVFFWTSRSRAVRLAAARGNRHAEQRLLVLDTASLLSRHASRAELSPINSGATYPLRPAARGAHTFTPLAAEPPARRPRDTGERRPVVELTILGAVNDALDHVAGIETFAPRPRIASQVERHVAVRP